uniref:Secreted protein n=1 Tax=Globodera pallida TaxID=36090 RepID=A0A183BSI6_GLOPA
MFFSISAMQIPIIAAVIVSTFVFDGALAFGPRAFLKRQAAAPGEMSAKSMEQAAGEQQQQQKHLAPYATSSAAQFQMFPFFPAPAFYYGGGGGVGGGYGVTPQQQKRFDYAPADSYGSEGFYPFVTAKRFDVSGYGAYGPRGRFSGFL